MSKLRTKLAALPEFTITGYNAFKGAAIIFFIETQDNELKKRFLENKLSASERNFILGTVQDFFADTVQTDESLFNYGIGSILVDYMEGNMKLPEQLINKQFIEEKAMQKKQKSNEKVFNKNKFNALPLSEKLQAVTNVDDFINFVWIQDYEQKNLDINNLVTFKDQVIEDDDTEASILKTNKILAAMVKN